MSKRTLLLVVALIVSLAVASTGTLAYLTATDSDVNVMTLGNVDIEQHEMKRAEGVKHNATLKDGDLVPFEDGIKLYPAYPVNNAAGDYSAEGTDGSLDRLMYWGPYVHTGTAGNGLWDDAKLVGAVDKMVFVENTGSSDAYFRTLIAFECPEGISIGEPSDGAEIMINVNGTELYKPLEDRYCCTIEVDGVTYEVIEFVYQDALLPGEWSHPSLLQVVMTHHATGEDMELLGETYEILALSQAVATENMPADAELALDTAFGDVTEATATEWFSAMEGLPVTTVSTAEELAAALAEGGTVVLTEDLELMDQAIVVDKGVEATLVLGGNTITGYSSAATTSNQIHVKNGASLTISGEGSVEFTAGTPDTDWGEGGSKPYPGYANNTIRNEGKLVIDGATIANKTAAGGASYAIDNYAGADLIVNSGEILGYDKVAIRMFSGNANVATSVTINGGVVEGKRAVWIQLPSNNAAVAPLTNLTVTGGSLNSTDDPSANYLAIYSYSYGNSFAKTNVNISGGTFNGHVAFGGGYKGDTENVTVTGGTFNGELGRYLANDGWEDIAKP